MENCARSGYNLYNFGASAMVDPLLLAILAIANLWTIRNVGVASLECAIALLYFGVKVQGAGSTASANSSSLNS